MHLVTIICLSFIQSSWFRLIDSLAITSGNCEKNVTMKYQVPVTKTRPYSNELLPRNDDYIEFEERTRWDVVSVCCPGYRTIIFGFCEPICERKCPPNSYCSEPSKCSCLHGYQPSHHPNKEHPIICRPTCHGGCPAHSHCVAYNKCECRPGFKDASSWFSPLHCERIHCGAEQRYDVSRHACVKIEMSIEELMKKVAEKLADGLDVSNTTDDTSENESDDERLNV